MSITAETIIDDLVNNRLILPTMPEVALRVREAIEDDDTSSDDVARIIQTDASLATSIMQIANSSLYRGINGTNSVNEAVMRMGLKTIRNLTICLVMGQMFQATHPLIDQQLRLTWNQSVNVAALSAVIAKTWTRLEADTALLAGLTHLIGLQPLLVKLESHPEILADKAMLKSLLTDLHPRIGSEILRHWGFNEQLAKVPSEHLDIGRSTTSGKADYADVVQVAVIQSLQPGDIHSLAGVDFNSLGAKDRLGMDNDMDQISIAGGADEVDEIRSALG